MRVGMPVSVSFEVILSLDDKPVSSAKLSVTAGATVSTVTTKAAEAALVSPAALVSGAVNGIGKCRRLATRLMR
jgi:hypothetical protein